MYGHNEFITNFVNLAVSASNTDITVNITTFMVLMATLGFVFSIVISMTDSYLQSSANTHYSQWGKVLTQVPEPLRTPSLEYFVHYVLAIDTVGCETRPGVVPPHMREWMDYEELAAQEQALAHQEDEWKNLGLTDLFGTVVEQWMNVPEPVTFEEQDEPELWELWDRIYSSHGPTFAEYMEATA